ncbi:MAG: hypothetical protein LC798_10920 [Chloroflexi bacterium]|nr:hypothetical protein [Chloroflexota bacterium]
MPDVLLPHLPIGDRGRYYHEQRAIVLRAGLLVCEQRAVLWHELVHLRRGDRSCVGTPYEAPQELAVQREACRLAMPWPVLRWGLNTSTTLHELVDAMKVDQDLVLFRLNNAHPAERGYIRRRQQEGEWAA